MRVNFKGDNPNFNEAWVKSLSREEFIERAAKKYYLKADEKTRAEQLNKVYDLIVGEKPKQPRKARAEAVNDSSDNGLQGTETEAPKLEP